MLPVEQGIPVVAEVARVTFLGATLTTRLSEPTSSIAGTHYASDCRTPNDFLSFKPPDHARLRAGHLWVPNTRLGWSRGSGAVGLWSAITPMNDLCLCVCEVTP